MHQIYINFVRIVQMKQMNFTGNRENLPEFQKATIVDLICWLICHIYDLKLVQTCNICTKYSGTILILFLKWQVLRKWKHRWNKSGRHTPLWYQQVIICLELALSCLHTDPHRRPSICDIIYALNELDNNGSVSTFDQVTHLLASTSISHILIRK
jgi:hypothetical protein